MDGQILVEAERKLFIQATTTGVQSRIVKDIWAWMFYFWLVLTPVVLGIDYLLGKTLGLVADAPILWILVGFLPFFTLSSAWVAKVISWVTPDSGETALWRPALVDFAVAAVSVVFGVATFILNGSVGHP